MIIHQCRACTHSHGEIILDLGQQPACDLFPPLDSTQPDPLHPLRMWSCASCGLAQLMEDPTTPEEPRGVEPQALIVQAHEAVAAIASAGLLTPGRTVTEYGSPHGGSWLPMLTAAGLITAQSDTQADIIVDCFGMMHDADQSKALSERVDRLSDGGTLLIQYHSLAAIVSTAQWNALRHGHFAYYSATTLATMLAEVGLSPYAAWKFDLYGGTVLLAAKRAGQPDESFSEITAWEARLGAHDIESLRGLQQAATVKTAALRNWLTAHQQKRIYGYGAASRTVTLLNGANIDVNLLTAVADASPAKWGRRIPGTRIPIVSPEQLVVDDPDSVLLFLPDLLSEVSAALPSLTGRWAIAEQVSTNLPPAVSRLEPT